MLIPCSIRWMMFASVRGTKPTNAHIRLRVSDFFFVAIAVDEWAADSGAAVKLNFDFECIFTGNLNSRVQRFRYELFEFVLMPRRPELRWNE